MARVTLTIVTILCLLQAVRVLGDRFNNSEIGTFAPTSNTYFDSRCQTKPHMSQYDCNLLKAYWGAGKCGIQANGTVWKVNPPPNAVPVKWLGNDCPSQCALDAKSKKVNPAAYCHKLHQPQLISGSAGCKLSTDIMCQSACMANGCFWEGRPQNGVCQQNRATIMFAFTGDARFGSETQGGAYFQGDFAKVGGRQGTIDYCKSMPLYKTLTCRNVVSLLSFNDSDSIANFPKNYGLKPAQPLLGPTGIMIAETWNKALNAYVTPLINDPNIAGVAGWVGTDGTQEYEPVPAGLEFWTGSLSSGAATDNCHGWTSNGCGTPSCEEYEATGYQIRAATGSFEYSQVTGDWLNDDCGQGPICPEASITGGGWSDCSATTGPPDNTPLCVNEDCGSYRRIACLCIDGLINANVFNG